MRNFQKFRIQKKPIEILINRHLVELGGETVENFT